MVCKLVELDGTPIIKLSSNKSKMTLPGNKILLRVSQGKIDGLDRKFDIIGTELDTIDLMKSGEISLYSLSNDYVKVTATIDEIKQISGVCLDNGIITQGFEFDV